MSDDFRDSQTLNEAGQAVHIPEASPGLDPKALQDQSATDSKRTERKGTPDDPDASQFLAYARQLLIPIIVTKSFIMYFGLNYSMYPDEGYGYGLAAAIICGVLSFSYFIWNQYRQQG